MGGWEKLVCAPLKEEHLDAVMLIEKASFPSPWSRQAYAYDLMKNDIASYCGVFSEDGRLLAFGGFWHVLDEAHVTNIAVSPFYRRQGLGRLLMNCLISRAVSCGCRHLTLEVRDSNIAARALYTSLGFVEQGVRRGYYQDNREDAVIMWLHLPAAAPGK